MTKQRALETSQPKLLRRPRLPGLLRTIVRQTDGGTGDGVGSDVRQSRKELDGRTLRSATIGQAVVAAESSRDRLKMQVPEGILSEEEFSAWANGLGFGHGQRNTYYRGNREAFLYVKQCLSVPSEEDVAPALGVVRHLTAVGVLHPDTQWGAYKRNDRGFQLFPVSPRIHAITLNDLLRRPQEFPEFQVPHNQEGSFLLEWRRRADPDFVPGSVLSPQEAPEGSLVRLLNPYEASHPENWGYDDTGALYPVDVEVIRLRGNMDRVNRWAANQASQPDISHG